MKNARTKWNIQRRFVVFCCFSLPLVLLAGTVLVFFGSSLSPLGLQQVGYDGRASEALTYSRSVVERCIELNRNTDPTECRDLADVLGVFNDALDVRAHESVAGSALYLSRLGYWQYLINGWTLILIALASAVSFALLNEVGKATNYVRETLALTRDRAESELQPYLNITDVTVQTGEPSRGGGDGWINITFKNSGKTPARNFRNHQVEKSPAPLFSQYVELLDGVPVVHTINGPDEGRRVDISADAVLLELLNTGEERTVCCPVVTDILDQNVRQAYMKNEWERLSKKVKLPQVDGYSIRGSVDFSNSFDESTTRRLRFELRSSVDNGNSFKILEDRKL